MILWYAMFTLCYTAVVDFANDEFYLELSTFTIIVYSAFGVVSGVFFGQYRLINFSLWIMWMSMITFTLISALMLTYTLPEWFQTLLPSMTFILALSMFQVTAVQFGTDQLQGASSNQLSMFIYWFFCINIMHRIIIKIAQLLFRYLPSNIVTNADKIQVGYYFLCSFILSVVLCTKSCFMSNWFHGEIERGKPCTMCTKRLGQHNPYALIYHVLKFALKNKHPVQRSALTYWEDKIPSRIDLGKSKYGGPFTTEEVDNVKTALRLIKTMLSLAGIFVVSRWIDVSMLHLSVSVTILTKASCSVITVGLLVLLYAVLFFPCCRKLCPSMLNRIWIGAVLTTACALSILLLESIGSGTKHVTNEQDDVTCLHSIQSLNLNQHVFLVPAILYYASYAVLTVSLFEFIIAQSPNTVKVMLIGLYYTLRYGVAGVLVLLEDYAFRKYPTSGFVLNCGTAYSLEMTLLALLSLIMYSVVACKYKLRERDEVVNVHIFAEEYYTK